ncbi:unnamed protein product, partial [Pylaiella littoralis]
MPYNQQKFRGVAMRNRIPAGFDGFVAAEVRTLLARGCVAKWDDVRTPASSSRPRMVMPL